ncbi:hypothetical protein GF314_16420 [bacterium]|nr:hypothetical protein [bacterium]
MKILLTLALCLALTVPALAEKPQYDTPGQPDRVPCGLTSIVHDWDFAISDHGFTTAACDDQGVPVWEHGPTSYIPDVPGDCWGTDLDADYALDAGESLVSPTFSVDATTYLVEVVHYYSMEYLWDGGNVTVNGEAIAPLVGYPGLISVPQDWYSWCVDEEMGFTGVDSGWLTTCFDLSAYVGQDVTLSFDFGADDFGVEAGWYIAAVRVGSDQAVPVEQESLTGIKARFD